VDLLGIDVGFGFTKATNGRDVLVFKSILGEATEIQYREQLLDAGPREEHLHLEVDGTFYFAGELAERQSNARFFTLDHDQFVSRFSKPLALAAVSRLVERNAPVKLVTGLPVSYYRRHREELAKALTGRHQVTLADRQGKRSQTVLNVDQVRVVPQPFGSLFNLMLNDMGEAGDRRFLHEKIGVIDVGFRTADYTVADRTRYSERGSYTSEHGIAEAFGTVASRLQDKSGVNVELYRLYDSIGRGWIKIRGKKFDLQALTDKVFEQLSTSIATEVNRLWADDWDIDTIVLTGGGGEVLAPHLKPMLAGEILAAEPNADARFNNVHGYRKYGKHLWARAARASATSG